MFPYFCPLVSTPQESDEVPPDQPLSQGEDDWVDDGLGYEEEVDSEVETEHGVGMEVSGREGTA